jgi:uncharacterized protein
MSASIPHIGISESALNNFCKRWRIRELALFGSVLREDFRPDSDIDVLVTFEQGAGWTLIDFVQMRDELREITKRNIDLLTRNAIERSRNPIRRQEILETARVIYAA